MNRHVALMLCGGMMLAATFGYHDAIDALLCRITAAFCIVYGYAKANVPR